MRSPSKIKPGFNSVACQVVVDLAQPSHMVEGSNAQERIAVRFTLGVDIRRSRTLRVNYRTTHQIRTQADRLLGPVVTDVDGNSKNRSDTVSVFNGPPPIIHSLKDESEEIKIVGNWIAEQAKAGVMPHEFGVFVRSAAQLDRARAIGSE